MTTISSKAQNKAWAISTSVFSSRGLWALISIIAIFSARKLEADHLVEYQGRAALLEIIGFVAGMTSLLIPIKPDEKTENVASLEATPGMKNRDGKAA